MGFERGNASRIEQIILHVYEGLKASRHEWDAQSLEGKHDPRTDRHTFILRTDRSRFNLARMMDALHALPDAPSALVRPVQRSWVAPEDQFHRKFVLQGRTYYVRAIVNRLPGQKPDRLEVEIVPEKDVGNSEYLLPKARAHIEWALTGTHLVKNQGEEKGLS